MNFLQQNSWFLLEILATWKFQNSKAVVKKFFEAATTMSVRIWHISFQTSSFGRNFTSSIKRYYSLKKHTLGLPQLGCMFSLLVLPVSMSLHCIWAVKLICNCSQKIVEPANWFLKFMWAEMLALGVWKCAISGCLVYKGGSGWWQNSKKDGTFRGLQVWWRKEEKKFCLLQWPSRKACSIPWCFCSTVWSQSKVLCELIQSMPGWPLRSMASDHCSKSSENNMQKPEDLLKI